MSEAEKAREVACTIANLHYGFSRGSRVPLADQIERALLQLRRDTVEECAKCLQDKFDGADALAKFAPKGSLDRTYHAAQKVAFAESMDAIRKLSHEG